MLPPAKRELILGSLTEHDAELLRGDWRFWLRENQLPPPRDWGHVVWLPMAGRGWGKTQVGAYATQQVAEAGNVPRIHLVGETAADARDVMVEGPSGILATAPNEFRPQYEPSKRRLTWPNGVQAITFSGDEPKQLRGPQCGFAWADEIAKWRYRDAWDQLMFGLRMGTDPWCVATTTPKPTKLILDLLDDETTLVTHGTTYDNLANLADAFVTKIVRRYEGTRLGQQELLARVLTEAAGALWKRTDLEATRVASLPEGGLIRVVVAVDPAVTVDSEGSNETGIVVAGLDSAGRGYVLDDLSGRYSPDQWGRKARWAFHQYQADRIVAERNNGGDMVERTIRQVQAPREHLPVSTVWASRGKHTRAEPIAALWEQKRGHMVGSFGDLEDQLCGWEPGDTSPDRLDAMVWAFTELFFTPTVERDLGDLPHF